MLSLSIKAALISIFRKEMCQTALEKQCDTLKVAACGDEHADTFSSVCNFILTIIVMLQSLKKHLLVSSCWRVGQSVAWKLWLMSVKVSRALTWYFDILIQSPMGRWVFLSEPLGEKADETYGPRMQRAVGTATVEAHCHGSVHHQFFYRVWAFVIRITRCKKKKEKPQKVMKHRLVVTVAVNRKLSWVYHPQFAAGSLSVTQTSESPRRPRLPSFQHSKWVPNPFWLLTYFTIFLSPNTHCSSIYRPLQWI